MKTNPTSIRFEKEDFEIAIALTGITKPQKLVDFLLAEYVRNEKKPFKLLKEYRKDVAFKKATGEEISIQDLTGNAKTNFAVDTSFNRMRRKKLGM